MNAGDYDFQAIGETLFGHFPTGADRRWLEQSWEEPEAFCDALLQHAQATDANVKSRFDSACDLYQDLIVRHMRAGRELFSCPEGPTRAWTSLDAPALDALTARLAGEWSRGGIEEGASIAILSEFGPAQVAAIATALRLGLAFSVVEPLGPSHIAAQLELLQPAWVVCHRDRAASAGEIPTQTFDITAAVSGAPFVGSVGYAPDATVLRMISPWQEGDDAAGPGDDGSGALVELSAGRLLACLLRDVHVVFSITPGDRVASLGLDPGTYLPPLLLCTWFGGGCYVHVDAEDAARQTSLLAEAAPTLALVSPGARDLLMAMPQEDTASWKRWCWISAEAFDWARWTRFAARFEEARVGSFGLLYSAPFGGALAFSARFVRPDPRVIPVPGIAWSFEDLGGLGGTVPTEAGLLAVEGASQAETGRFLLSRAEEAYVFGGSTQPLVSGRPYPNGAAARIAEDHPAVAAAIAVMLPDLRVMNHGHPSLLLFVDPRQHAAETFNAGALIAEVSARLKHELGEVAVPDRVEVFPLHPKMLDGRPDRVWCEAQYQTGMLGKKSKLASFRALAALRGLFAPEADST